ncbi:MAG: YcaO-like family protein [Deltaproteobacteria bacterium]|nr:YcaO-like family protein [Deltaproteobacteria bacterium]
MSHKIQLKDAYKGYTLDQDKICSPEETVRRFKERLRSVNLDILKETVRIDTGRLDIPVYFSVCGRDAEAVTGTRKQMGKGGTPAQSEASAVMELAERFSFFSFWRDSGNFVVDEYRNLTDPAIGFEAIARSVHDESGDLDAAREIFSRLPLKWIPAYNLTRDETLLIPFDWFFAINEYNGPSAGNCMEEAISQGICELMERHVSSIVSRNRLKTPGINPDSATDPLVREMLQKYRHAGIRLFVSDFSLDTGIPTIGVLAYDPTTFPDKSEIVWTAGTTPDPEKALSRALTEVAQLGGDFSTGSNYMASGLPKFKTLPETDFIRHPDAYVDMDALPDLSSDNIRREVENCVEALRRIHMEVFLVDVTHPRLQVPALYTIIPGAHFRERAVGTSVGMFSAKIVTEQGNPEWAIQKLKEMEQLLPDQYYLQFFLGLSHIHLDRYEEALPYLESALDLDPRAEDVPTIYSYMGVCLKALERYADALAVLQKGVAWDRDRTDIHNLMGFCYFKQKEHEKAIEAFQKVLHLDPGSAIDYANIASNYREMGNREMAVHYYRLALELDPQIDFARDHLKRLTGKGI